MSVPGWLRATEDESGCWLWLGAVKSNGYGNVVVNRRTVMAHRYSWERHHGPIPDGLYVLHRCDVRRCVRPDHLFLGTAAENTADMMRKGRQRSPIRRLDDAVRAAIRAAALSGTRQHVLAEQHGIAQSTVSNIVRGVHP